MIEYLDPVHGRARRVAVSGHEDVVEVTVTSDGDHANLDRDAVAALVGQLSSWLQREAKP